MVGYGASYPIISSNTSSPSSLSSLSSASDQPESTSIPSFFYTPSFVSRHRSPRPFSSFLLLHLSHPHLHQKCPLFDNTWCNMLLSLPSIPASSHGLLLLHRLQPPQSFPPPHQVPTCPFTYDLNTLVVSNGIFIQALRHLSSTGSTRLATVWGSEPRSQYCFWHQGLICVCCCYTWPEILYYKVSRRIWHWLPKCPSLPDKWSCGDSGGFPSRRSYMHLSV